MTMTQCGYCGGTGKTVARTHDNHGYQVRDYGTLEWCEYCGGAGQCEEGHKLEQSHRGTAETGPLQPDVSTVYSEDTANV